MLCALALGAMVVIALNPGCSKMGGSENVTTATVSSGIEYIKSWFYGKWQPPKAAIAVRTSPWLHDTSFIINNYSNIIPQWHLAKIYYRDGVKFTEVPAILPDTLEFKIGSGDSTELFNCSVRLTYRESRWHYHYSRASCEYLR